MPAPDFSRWGAGWRRDGAGRRTGPSRRQPAPQREKSGAGKWVALVLVVLLIAGGAIAYQAVNSSRDKSVQLDRDVGGNVDDAVQSFQDLISDNTR